MEVANWEIVTLPWIFFVKSSSTHRESLWTWSRVVLHKQTQVRGQKCTAALTCCCYHTVQPTAFTGAATTPTRKQAKAEQEFREVSLHTTLTDHKSLLKTSTSIWLKMSVCQGNRQIFSSIGTLPSLKLKATPRKILDATFSINTKHDQLVLQLYITVFN